MPKRCFIPPENVLTALLAHAHGIRQIEQRLHLLAALRRWSPMPFSTAMWSSRSQRRDPRIDAEVLRQITQPAPQLLRLGEHVDTVENDRPRVRLLQRRDRAHQRRLARAVGAEQPEQSAPDREIYSIEGANTVTICL